MGPSNRLLSSNVRRTLEGNLIYIGFHPLANGNGPCINNSGFTKFIVFQGSGPCILSTLVVVFLTIIYDGPHIRMESK